MFCSLRLSVRTPPFHGGESGSIPLGSAKSATTIDFPLFLNDLANTPECVLDVLLDGRRAPHCALICSAAAPRSTVVEAIESVSIRPSRCQYAPLSDRLDHQLAAFKRHCRPHRPRASVPCESAGRAPKKDRLALFFRRAPVSIAYRELPASALAKPSTSATYILLISPVASRQYRM